jgi:hypothetical protein
VADLFRDASAKRASTISPLSKLDKFPIFPLFHTECHSTQSLVNKCERSATSEDDTFRSKHIIINNCSTIYIY